MKKNRKGIGLFQLIDRHAFDRLVEKWGMDKWVRGLQTWELTCALISAMTMRLQSYREIEQALGIPRATLGDALARRHSGFFTELCDEILLQIRARTKDRKVKRAIRQIMAIDSSEIRVHGSLFSSPGWQQKAAEGHQAAAKLHAIWNVDGEWIDDYLITGARLSDSRIGRLLEIRAGKIYVFDRAYNDVTFWLEIIEAGSHFVTRLKELSIAKLKEGKAAEAKRKDGVLYDGIYRPCLGVLQDIPAEERLAVEFRYVVYRDPLTKKVFYFVTSDRKISAQTVADIYKKRWAVELLFRWMKGHLDVRYLPVKNKNAVKVQLAIAVMIQLMLQMKKIKDRFQGTLWELLRSIRTELARQTLILSGSPDGCRWSGPPRKDLGGGFG